MFCIIIAYDGCFILIKNWRCVLYCKFEVFVDLFLHKILFTKLISRNCITATRVNGQQTGPQPLLNSKFKSTKNSGSSALRNCCTRPSALRKPTTSGERGRHTKVSKAKGMKTC
ncbi:hypothetical protein Hanom_Chr17g01531961 [Helianthus anomalus]